MAQVKSEFTTRLCGRLARLIDPIMWLDYSNIEHLFMISVTSTSSDMLLAGSQSIDSPAVAEGSLRDGLRRLAILRQELDSTTRATNHPKSRNVSCGWFAIAYLQGCHRGRTPWSTLKSCQLPGPGQARMLLSRPQLPIESNTVVSPMEFACVTIWLCAIAATCLTYTGHARA